MRVIYRKIRHARYLYIKRNVEKVWGARYTLGVRYLSKNTVYAFGPGSSVGITTDYGLDGLGSSSGWDEIFRPFRPALGPTQSPVKWVPCLSRG